MAKQKEEQRTHLPGAPKLVVILGLIAYFISLYLAIKTFKGDAQLAGCGGELADCGSVIQTQWGKWFGIPVSAGALLIYAAISILAYQMRAKATKTQWLALLMFSVVAAGSALWFVALQLFEVKSYCLYCMAVHTCGIILTILVFKKFPRDTDPVRKKSARDPVIPSKLARRAVIAGLAAVMIFAAGQIYSAKYSPVDVETATYSGSNTISAEGLHGRQVTLADGKIQVNTAEFPVFGSPDAPNVVAHFFDYTCPACREFHSTLMSSYRESANRTALIMIPIPLDAACNPTVNQTTYLHKDACNFAKYGLALWKTAPEKYSAYDEFMFGSQFPPSGENALSFANQLAGAENIEKALDGMEIPDLLRKGLQMFYSPAVPQKILPALATPSRVVLGYPEPGVLPKLMSGS